MHVMNLFRVQLCNVLCRCIVHLWAECMVELPQLHKALPGLNVAILYSIDHTRMSLRNSAKCR